MRIDTYNKRFDLPLIYIDLLFMPIVKARNGKLFRLRINERGEPVASSVNKEFMAITQGEVFALKSKAGIKSRIPAATVFKPDGSIRHKLGEDLLKTNSGSSSQVLVPVLATKSKDDKVDIKFT